MKIGILTLPFNNNYGGYLQAIALVEVLRRIGHEPCFIYRRRDKKGIKAKAKCFILGLRGLFIKSKRHPFFHDSERDFMRKGINIIPFVESRLKPMTEKIYDSDTLKKYGCVFDAYIVGSDQVWRPIFVPQIEDYFFRFVSNPSAKLVAYAASFGCSAPEYTNDQILNCGELIKRFSALSLRESSGVNVMNKLGWTFGNVEVVLDPTLLLPKDFYLDFIKGKEIPSSKVFCYILDSNSVIEQIIEEVEKDRKCVSFWILSKNWKNKTYVMPSIQEWLRCLVGADYVVTDSYHGTVFSILFNKPFVVYINERRGVDRIDCLLDHFGLLDRKITRVKDYGELKRQKILWGDVNNRLNNMREKSLGFLQKALKE